MSNVEEDFINQYQLREKLEGIENKILERGVFTKHFGSYFDIKLNIDYVNETHKNMCFTIKIDSDKEKIKETAVIEASQYIRDFLLLLVSQESDEEVVEKIRRNLKMNFYFNQQQYF